MCEKEAQCLFEQNEKYKQLGAFCKTLMEQEGHKMQFVDNKYVGMIHGLGHGVGLEIHEEPCFRNDAVMEEADIFTIEPGLYYPDVGGVRIEDSYYIKNG